MGFESMQLTWQGCLHCKQNHLGNKAGKHHFRLTSEAINFRHLDGIVFLGNDPNIHDVCSKLQIPRMEEAKSCKASAL